MNPAITLAFGVSIVGSIAVATVPQAQQARAATLIPREVLFGNPQRSGARISPDGSLLGFIAPRDGVLNVWVQPIKDGHPAGEPKPITKSTERPIRQWSFVHGGGQVVYSQDRGGDENFQIFAVDLASGDESCLTPWPETRSSIIETDRDHPHQILVSVNNRDPHVFDAWKIDTQTGKGEMVFQNDGGWLGMLPDKDWNIKLVTRMTPDGAVEALMRDNTSAEWQPFCSWKFEDSATSEPLNIAKDGRSVFVYDSARSETKNTGGLYEVTFVPKGDKQQWKLLASDARCEPGQTIIDPKTYRPQAITFEHLRREWKPLDASIAADFAALKKVIDGDFFITSRSDSDQLWTVAFTRDNGPVETYLYDRSSKNANLLFVSNDLLKSQPLVKMQPEVIKSRDGLDLVSYLTLPKDYVMGKSKPIPMVLFVHGGPWGRDSWGYDPYHQWLANRGYAVLSVNFRGSTGFGKDFVNAGNRQWSKKMHDDLIDSVRWAVAKGIADPKKVAIMGGSYGGYAALAGLTFTPDVFACAVDIVGPSNLATLLASIPPYWKPMKAMFEQRVGSESETEWLAEISPITHVDKIERPLLIGQGANDPRVKQAESDQIVAAMQKKRIPVTYVLFPDEGHGFARPENNMAFNAVAEAFLAQHLGGEYEPIGSAVAKSSAKVPAGKELIPGWSNERRTGPDYIPLRTPMPLLIRHGHIVTATDEYDADIYCEGESITRIERAIELSSLPRGTDVIDASGKLVFPGFIDPHVHVYLPFMGTYAKDTWESASEAALLGGTTTLIEMICPGRTEEPLAAFETWLGKAKGTSSCDFTFHMGVTRFDERAEKQFREIVKRGITSFKVFLAYKGALGVDDTELYRTLRLAKELGVVVTAHCENETLVAERQAELMAEGKTGPEWHEPSRPVQVEAEGVHHLMTFAELTGAEVYVVHTSCDEALREAVSAKERGVRAHVEVVLPHLVFDKSYAERPNFEGAKFVMSPPLREKRHQDALWNALRAGHVSTVGTDHAPFDFEAQKSMGKGAFTKIPNGIPSVEHRVDVLYTHGVAAGRIDVNTFVAAASTNAARIFGLTKKGTIAIGADADLVVFDPNAKWKPSPKTHRMATDYSAFEGMELRGRSNVVTVRGKVMVRDGKLVPGKGHGRLIERTSSSSSRMNP